MTRTLVTEIETFPIAGVFTISRGSRTEARVVTCTLGDGAVRGQGECVPYTRYDETVESVVEQIEAIRQDLINGIDRTALMQSMPPGAARNAVDCALWDLEAKLSGKRAALSACTVPPRPLPTAYTISLGAPEDMAAQARAHAARPLLKVKLGSDNDAARIHAVAGAAPESRLIVDANEGWTEDNILENMLAAAEFHVALIEQPLPAGKDELLRHIPHPVPVCADESVHTADNLKELAGLYDFVNIKLDKTGGLTAALELRDKAREMGFGVMVGCMVGTSLAMAPAVLLAQGADFVDLDGPLLLARDRPHGLRYSGSLVSPPAPQLWG
ncbi:N-acetyl-D-Glu racemase DgcA [Nitratireductor sp. ZSWI3]|uniref:N-acetyl-D-Glu racemase DgcA n=1 Tax=Nitratireductor sp. ZSWI3 TaxID=2966359 RepID=UPI00214FB509|nr:N-acetyl-D-Glu racemase DgcA [Nitratireductor sp. ZSWI3]MCR4266664.1 dipeptide epimerase [Nitratireductor sp. ZSWI3]